MFHTQYSVIGNRLYANSGTGVEPDFELVIDKDGEEVFEQVGETDVYSKIQSYREMTELSILLDKFAKQEIDPFTMSQKLNVKQGVYLDAVGMPQSYAEMFDRAREAEAAFARLPSDVKAEFDNSHLVFWSQMGSQRFNDVMAKYYKPDPQELGEEQKGVVQVESKPE